MRFLAFVFAVFALACGAESVLKIVTGHFLQGVLLCAAGALMAFAAGGCWSEGDQ